MKTDIEKIQIGYGQNIISSILNFIWPIESNEKKKFIPMALMFACILFNYSMSRSIKDSLIVTTIGAEAISVIKTYGVLPAALIAAILYGKLCNMLQPQKVFYTIISFFALYFLIFALILYPNSDLFNASQSSVNQLVAEHPHFQWFIKAIGCWTYTSFYIMSELWGAIALTLLFWQFANQTTKSTEAKRFYPMFGLIANMSLLLTSVLLKLLLNNSIPFIPSNLKLLPIFLTLALSCLAILYLYYFINNNVLSDPSLYDPKDPTLKNKKKKKTKLGFLSTLKMIFSSQYLMLIGALVLSYGISINLVENVWKAQLQKLFSTAEEYALYMADFQLFQGIATIICMMIGGSILRHFSWRKAALLTPIMILITGSIFFSFILFHNTLNPLIATLVGASPLIAIIFIGMLQNILSKATKYSLFDATKEMSYIPLDNEMQTKGKVAVDSLAGRLGKSGGGFIISSFFLLFPSLGFTEGTVYFAAVFFVIIVLWIFSVLALGIKYNTKINQTQAEEIIA